MFFPFESSHQDSHFYYHYIVIFFFFFSDTEWLEYDTILSKRIYLEDINEENWVINLQELFNSGRSPVSPQRRHSNQHKTELLLLQSIIYV